MSESDSDFEDQFHETDRKLAQHYRDLQEYAENAERWNGAKPKIVGSTGTTYRTVLPQFSPTTRGLEYKLGKVVPMNKTQRDLQRQGKLPGCIANCQVQPIGQGRKSGRPIQYPDPNTILFSNRDRKK